MTPGMAGDYAERLSAERRRSSTWLRSTLGLWLAGTEIRAIRRRSGGPLDAGYPGGDYPVHDRWSCDGSWRGPAGLTCHDAPGGRRALAVLANVRGRGHRAGIRRRRSPAPQRRRAVLCSGRPARPPRLRTAVPDAGQLAELGVAHRGHGGPRRAREHDVCPARLPARVRQPGPRPGPHDLPGPPRSTTTTRRSSLRSSPARQAAAIADLRASHDIGQLKPPGKPHAPGNTPARLSLT